MHLVASEASIPRPTNDVGVRVYFNQAFENRQLSKVREQFEPDRIQLEQVLAEPTKYLMVFRPSMTELDFGNVLPASSRCLYSYWKGYLEKPDWVELRKSLSQVGGDFIPAHASGHIYVEDIVELVRGINPKRIVPIHTFEPTGFQQHFANVQLLDDGEPYRIG
jgi:ribonuclease J